MAEGPRLSRPPARRRGGGAARDDAETKRAARRRDVERSAVLKLRNHVDARMTALRVARDERVAARAAAGSEGCLKKIKDLVMLKATPNAPKFIGYAPEKYHFYIFFFLFFHDVFLFFSCFKILC